MKARRKTPKKGSSKHVPEYVNDDKVYGNLDEPDPESREYIYDDIDEFHANKEKILLETGHEQSQEIQDSDEDEVLALDSEDSDDEEIRNLKAQLRKVKQHQRKDALGSDIEDEDNDDEAGEQYNRAWGIKRSSYYGVDDIDMNRVISDDEEAEAILEEKEALRLQKQMADELEEQDFGLDMFQSHGKVTKTDEKEEKITKDLSLMSDKEKLKIIKKKSPELLTLIEEFKEKMAEFEKLSILKSWIDKEKIVGNASDYVSTKLKLNINYCTNIVFYLMLKSKQISAENHPVVRRLLMYKKISDQLKSADAQLKNEINDIVQKIQHGGKVQIEERPVGPMSDEVSDEELTGHEQDIGLPSDSDDDYEDFIPKKSYRPGTAEVREALKTTKTIQPNHSEDNPIESDMEEEVEENENGVDETADVKRAISYQIEKNKGLTAKKKKELRNPRVKHRMKFKKAKIRRKGQYREPRTEMQKYAGEISGIRAGVKRGVKLK